MKRIISFFVFMCVITAAPVWCGDVYSEKLRHPLQNFYDKCLQAGLLSASGASHKIDFAQLEQSANDGYATLQLIESLEKQQDETSTTLLAAINELCYRRFISLLSLFDQNEHALVIEKLHYLAQKEVVTDGVCITPFKSALSKMLLMVAIINAKKIKPIEKKEFLVHALSAVEVDMLKINQGLGVEKVQEQEIRDLVAALEVYAVKIPAVGMSALKITVLATAITIVVLLIVIYVGPFVVDKSVLFLRQHVIQPIILGTTADAQQSLQQLTREAEQSMHRLADGAAADLGFFPRMFAFGRWLQPDRQQAGRMPPPVRHQVHNDVPDFGQLP